MYVEEIREVKEETEKIANRVDMYTFPFCQKSNQTREVLDCKENI